MPRPDAPVTLDAPDQMSEHDIAHPEPRPEQMQGPAQTQGEEPAGAPSPEQPPPVPDTEFRRVDPGFIRAERTGWLIVAAALSLGGLVGVAIVLGTAPMIAKVLVPIGWVVLVGALALCTWRIPPLVYRHIAWRVSEEGIEIKRGILWKSVTNVPRSRIQHTDVDQGPIMRHCGVAKLVIHTAGTRDATVDLPGLRAEEAFHLRDYLLAGASDDGRS